MNKYSSLKLPTDVQLELASKFRELRKDKKYSQTLLAQRSGVSLGSIKRFENTSQISLESLLKLANLFNRLDDFNLVFKIDTELKKVEKLFTK